jgi:alpha-tubulin suppressor-like RCC1 family protein
LLRTQLLLCCLFLSGCAEVRTLVSVLWSGATSLSTSGFEVDDIKSGNKVSCVLLADKTVRCLGPGLKGSLGRFNGAPVPVLKEVKEISLGKGFSCTIAGDKDQLFCFGRNDKGQLGNNRVIASVDPMPVLDAENGNVAIVDVKQVAAGENHACALLKNGRAICWGDNSFGQAGNPSLSIGVKTIVENDRTMKAFQGIHEIFAGVNSTCFTAKDDFSAYCFGERYGAIKKMNWNPERVDLAGSIGTLGNVKKIGLGRGFGCALSRSSQVYCWGRNDFNQLGALSTLPGTTKALLVQVTYPQEQPLSKIDMLSVGEFHACALHRDEKTVYCWGDNKYGQLGNTSVRGLPEQVALGSNNLTLKGVANLAVGPDRTCIISSREEVFCWGNGANGILGSEKVLSPYPIRALDANGDMLTSAAQISLGFDHACIIDTSQKLYCFGINEFGQLGSRSIAGQVILGDLKPATKVNALDTHSFRTCMVYGDNQSVACFGDREIDNLNQKYETNSFVPEEIKKGTQAYRGALGVSVGNSHICIITSEQKVDCLGEGSKGQLGANDSQNLKSGTVQDEQQHAVTDIWQIKTVEDFNCGLKQESGSIWCWGNWRGDRWLNAKIVSAAGRPSADFIQISMSTDQVCGIHGVERNVLCSARLDKTSDHPLQNLNLVAMSDSEGKLLKKVLSISGGKNHFCALDEESRVFCWGSNEYGQLGTRSVKESLKPLRFLATKDALKKVSRVSAGDHHTCLASSDEASLYCFGENFFGGANSPEPVEYPL